MQNLKVTVLIVAFAGVLLVSPAFADLSKGMLAISGIAHAQRKGDKIYVAAGENGLKVVDIKLGKVIKDMEFEGKAFYVATGNDKIYLSTSSGIYVIDEESFKVETRITLKDNSYEGVAVINKDVIAVVGTSGGLPLNVLFVQVSTGKTLADVNIGMMYGNQFQLHGDQLYVPEGYPGAVSIIDIKEYKLIRKVELREDWLHAVRVFGERAFVAGHLNGIGMLNLQSAEYQEITKDRNATLFVKDDRLFSLTGEAILELDTTSGKILKQIPVKAPGKGWMRSFIIDIEGERALIMIPEEGIAVEKLK